MSQTSFRRWARAVRGVLQAAGIAALLGFALWRFAYSLAGAPDEPVAASWCRAAYARAGGRPDSAAVDAQVPVTSREQATTAVNCGTLRAAGALAR
ncbi:MAG: hypothetical protein ACJ79S_13240 [Gemmatimonadaceae bacterium]